MQMREIQSDSIVPEYCYLLTQSPSTFTTHFSRNGQQSFKTMCTCALVIHRGRGWCCGQNEATKTTFSWRVSPPCVSSPPMLWASPNVGVRAYHAELWPLRDHVDFLVDLKDDWAHVPQMYGGHPLATPSLQDLLTTWCVCVCTEENGVLSCKAHALLTVFISWKRKSRGGKHIDTHNYITNMCKLIECVTSRLGPNRQERMAKWKMS